MKKVCKSMLAVVMVVLMVFAVAACGGNNGGSASVVGTWKMTIDSSKFPEEYKEQASMYEALLSAMEITLTFSDNGKVTVNSSAMGQSSTAEGTYSFDGTTVRIVDPTGTIAQQGSTASGSSSNDAEMKLVDGKLVITGAEYMPFVKQ